ncbi:hypothetical protein ABPG77_009455 [Micractinium sp. CCAP 211/92]
MRAAIGALLLLAALATCQAKKGPGPLLGKPPYAIGHRGLCGVYPEHTIASYQGAIKAGADFIECDVVPTKDCKLICRHEPELTGTTDAAAKFPDRVQTFNIDGSNVQGVFSFNLTLAEIKTLRAKQRVNIRDPQYDGLFEVPTLAEYLAVAKGAPRVVGIYPETKHPSFHDSLGLQCFKGKTFTQAVIEQLAAAGYTGAINTPEWRARPAFLQSFEARRANLVASSKLTKLPMVFLTDDFDVTVPYESVTYGQVLANDTALKQLYAKGVRGIGPYKNTLVAWTPTYDIDASTIPAGISLVKRLHKVGFQVHIYTLRNEAIRPDGSGYLSWTFQEDPYLEYDLFYKRLGIDGAFTDQAHTLARYLKENFPRKA